MNVEIGIEAAQFPEKEFINGIFLVVQELFSVLQILVVTDISNHLTLIKIWLKESTRSIGMAVCVSPFVKAAARRYIYLLWTQRKQALHHTHSYSPTRTIPPSFSRLIYTHTHSQLGVHFLTAGLRCRSSLWMFVTRIRSSVTQN